MGDKTNYNLQSGTTPYQLGGASTIEWLADTKTYKGRALIENKTTHDVVAFNSLHTEFIDAERAIDLIADAFSNSGGRVVYNVFAETLETHTSPRPGGGSIHVFEVRPLIWSFLRR